MDHSSSFDWVRNQSIRSQAELKAMNASHPVTSRLQEHSASFAERSLESHEPLSSVELIARAPPARLVDDPPSKPGTRTNFALTQRSTVRSGGFENVDRRETDVREEIF